MGNKYHTVNTCYPTDYSTSPRAVQCSSLGGRCFGNDVSCEREYSTVATYVFTYSVQAIIRPTASCLGFPSQCNTAQDTLVYLKDTPTCFPSWVHCPLFLPTRISRSLNDSTSAILPTRWTHIPHSKFDLVISLHHTVYISSNSDIWPTDIYLVLMPHEMPRVIQWGLDGQELVLHLPDLCSGSHR